MELFFLRDRGYDKNYISNVYVVIEPEILLYKYYPSISTYTYYIYIYVGIINIIYMHIDQYA